MPSRRPPSTNGARNCLAMCVIVTVSKRTSREGADYFVFEQMGYYAGHGVEENGRWHDPNSLFAATPHGGEIGDDGAPALYHLFDGLNPDDPTRPLRQNASTLERLARRAGKETRNPDPVVVTDVQIGFDKGVSILWAGGTPEVKTAIRAAMDATADAVFNTIQDHLAFGRMGKDSLIKVPGKILSARFLHKASRPSEAGNAGDDATVEDLCRLVGDPQLHLHMVIPNVCRRPDGSWGAIDAREFIGAAKDLGAVARTVFMAEMKFRLPVRFVEGPDGLPRLDGIDEKLARTFSKRTENALEVVEKIVADDPSFVDNPKRLAALTKKIIHDQRNAKNRDNAGGRELDREAIWAEVLAEEGFDPSQVLGRPEPEDLLTPRPLDEVTREAIAKVFEQEAVIPTSKVIAAIYDAHAFYGTGETATAALRALVNDGELVGLEVIGVNHWTTRQILEDEATVGDLARAMATDGRYVAPIDALEAHFLCMEGEEVVLREDQTAALRRIICDPGTLVGLEGAAGSGKSFVLAQAARIWKVAGFKPIALAIAHDTSRRLAKECGGIGHDAIQPWLDGIAAGRITLDRDAVVIVDEAAQLSTRQMRDLLDVAGRVGARVILTGDRLQVKPIDAGAGFELVTRSIGGMRLETTVRQHDEWAWEAATDLSHGRGDLALDRFDERGFVRMHSGSSRPKSEAATRREMVAKWARYVDDPVNEGKTTLLMAIRRKDVREIGAEVRTHLIRSGKLGSDPCHFELVDEDAAASQGKRLARTEEELARQENAEAPRKTVEIRLGEQVRFRRKDERLGVVNGIVGKVRAIHDLTSGPVLDVEVPGEGGRPRMVRVDPDAYPFLTHAYASTVYGAQGATVDAAWVAVGKGWKRDLAYVAGSRSREPTEWHVDSCAVEDLVRNRVALSDRKEFRASVAEIREELGRLLSRRSEKRLASDYMAPPAPPMPTPQPEATVIDIVAVEAPAVPERSLASPAPVTLTAKNEGTGTPLIPPIPAPVRKYPPRVPKLKWTVRQFKDPAYRLVLNKIVGSPTLRRRVMPFIEAFRRSITPLDLTTLFRKLSEKPLVWKPDRGVAKLAKALIDRDRGGHPHVSPPRMTKLSDRVRAIAAREARATSRAPPTELGL